jgi:SAM-dependent methyltransferase
VTVDDHFKLVAPVYDSLRTTDKAPVRRIREMLPNSLLVGLDLGCGTGRYSRLLHALLPDGSLLAASDVSAAMLTELQAGCDSGAWVVPLRCTAEELPIRTGALDLVTAFNSVHHFDLGRFLAEAARVLGADGRLFVYTRTPEQNARTVWGRWFPGFTEREQRLYSEATLIDAVHHTRGLQLVHTESFRHSRSSTPERLRAQVEGRHYSTFSLYQPDELRQAIAVFLARLPGPQVSWIDEHLMVVAAASPGRGLRIPPARAGRRAGPSRARVEVEKAPT